MSRTISNIVLISHVDFHLISRKVFLIRYVSEPVAHAVAIGCDVCLVPRVVLHVGKLDCTNVDASGNCQHSIRVDLTVSTYELGFLTEKCGFDPVT